MLEKNEEKIPLFFQKGIEETFQIQLGSPATIKVSNKSSKDLSEVSKQIDILSVMGVSATGYEGSIAIGFPKSTFLRVVEKLLGEKHEDITSENADACSEILNIIYASSRKNINTNGFDFQPAIPSTIRGKELSLPLGNFSAFLTFECQSEAGPFLFVFSLKRV